MEIEQVPAEEWESWSSARAAMVLDVREPHEWELGTLPGSTLISMSALAGAVADFDRATPILAVCRSGARSQQVAIYLMAIGFAEVANLAGGVKALGMQD